MYFKWSYVCCICSHKDHNKAVGAAAARVAKTAALFRSLLNIHNQFSQVSSLALAWPRVLYVYMQSDSDSKTTALSKLTLTTLKPAQNPPPESYKFKIFLGGACPQTLLESAGFACTYQGERISVCSSGLFTFYLLPIGLNKGYSVLWCVMCKT